MVIFFFFLRNKGKKSFRPTKLVVYLFKDNDVLKRRRRRRKR